MFDNDVLKTKQIYRKKNTSIVRELRYSARLFWITIFVAAACFTIYLLLRVFRMGVPAKSAAPFVLIFIYCGACSAITVYAAINKLEKSLYLPCFIAWLIVFVPILPFIIFFAYHGVNILFPSIALTVGAFMGLLCFGLIRDAELAFSATFSVIGHVFAVLFLLLGIFCYAGTDRRADGKLERTVEYRYEYSIGAQECYVKRVWRTLGGGADVKLNGIVRHAFSDGNLVGIDGGAFDGYARKSVEIPATVVKISDNAFSGSKIRTVNLAGKEVVGIGFDDGALSDCVVDRIVTERVSIDFGKALGNVGDRAVIVRLENPYCRLSFDNASVGENVIFEVVKEKVDDFRAANPTCADRFVPIVDDDELFITVNDEDGSRFDGASTVIEKVGQADGDGKYHVSLSVPLEQTRRTKTVGGASRDEKLVLVAKNKQGEQVGYLSDATLDGNGNYILSIATAESLRLYTKWAPVYTVKFDLGSDDAEFVGDDFDGEDIEFYDNLDGKPTEIGLPSATCDGYAFVGWYRRGSLPREYYGEYNGHENVTVNKVKSDRKDDLELVADFRPYYNVLFNGMGVDFDALVKEGKAVVSDKLVDGNKYHELSGAIALPSFDDSARPGFEFDGWYTGSSYYGSAVTQIAAKSTGNKLFYAKWKLKSPTVTAVNYVDKIYDGKTHNIGVNAAHDCDSVGLEYTWSVASVSKTTNTLQVKNVCDRSYSVVATAKLSERVEYCTGFDTDGSEKTGTRTIAYSAAADAVDVSVKITPKPLTIAWKASDFVYDGTEKTVAYNVLDAVNGEDPSMTRTGATATNAGTYTATISCNDENYAVTVQSATHTWTIEKADYDMSQVRFEDITVEYDGARHSPTVTESSLPSGAKSGDELAIGSYSVGARNVAEGRKAVTVSFTPSSNYNKPSDMTAYVMITPRSITIKADDKTSVYGNTVTTTAQVTSGSVVAGDGSPWRLTTAASKTADVGTYEITGTGNNGNYSVTVNKGTYTVTARPITVKADNKSSVYGNDIVALTAQVTSGSVVNGDGNPWRLTTTASKTADVGAYDIVGTGNNGNYSVTVNKGTYTVTARPITVKADNKSSVYGNDIEALTARVTSGSVVDGDGNPWRLTTAASKTADVGSYDIVGSGNNGNYDVTIDKGTYTISQAELVVVWGEWEFSTSTGQLLSPIKAAVNIGGRSVELSVTIRTEPAEDGYTKYTATASFSPEQSGYARNYRLSDITASMKSKAS